MSRGKPLKTANLFSQKITAKVASCGQLFFYVNSDSYSTKGNCNSHPITTFLLVQTPFEFWGRLTAFTCPLDKYIISFFIEGYH